MLFHPNFVLTESPGLRRTATEPDILKTMQSRTESSHTTGACAACRVRKVKCRSRRRPSLVDARLLTLAWSTPGDGDTPCRNCLRRGRSCVYPISQRGKRPKSSDGDNSPTKRFQEGFRIVPYQRAARSAQKVAGASRSTGTLHTRPRASPRDSLLSGDQQDFHEASESFHGPDRAATAPEVGVTRTRGTVDNPADLHYPGQDSSIAPTVQSAGAPDSPDSAFDQPDFEEGIMSSEKAYWEHHGPWSWVSVCSEQGIHWVCKKTGTDSFIDMAKALTKAWSRRLRLKPDQARFRPSHELDESTAWKYATGTHDHPPSCRAGNQNSLTSAV